MEYNIIRLYTIGHSNHPITTLMRYLKDYGVDAVFDVRSHPYSRVYPQYRYKELQRILEKNGIAYLFYGKMLGARNKDPECLVNGRVDFTKLAATQLFRDGLSRLLIDIRSHRGCLLCSEKEPLVCHRTILICRHLTNFQIAIRHILADGTVEEHSKTQQRLIRLLHLNQMELFDSPEKQLERAYDIQGNRLTGLET